MKNKVFIAVFTTILWVKQAQPAEPILLTSKLLMEALRTTPADPANEQ